MSAWLASHEAAVRLLCFVGVFGVMALWELAAPRRAWSVGRRPRWSSHLLLSALNVALIRVLLPAGLVGVALWAGERGIGLFNIQNTSYPVAVAASVVALDFAIYLQHVLFHRVPWLWRLHRVHHADLDIDVTTGVRFHPVEILLSLGIKSAAVLLLGAPALSVLIFEVLLNGTTMFNHANVRMPPSVDRWLRWFVVTPDMHRVHHSTALRETNSNFGFNLPWWDRLAGTYKAQPDGGHDGMTIGLDDWRDGQEVHRFSALLAMPLKRPDNGRANRARRR